MGLFGIITLSTVIIIVTSYGIYSWRYVLSIYKKYPTLNYEENLALEEHDGSDFAYKILTPYTDVLLDMGKKLMGRNNPDDPLFMYNEKPVSYREFMSDLQRMRDAFKNDTDNDIYNHVALKHRMFFSIYADKIIKIPQTPHFFSPDKKQADQERQVLAMSHSYHAMITEVVNAYKEQHRQATLTDIKEAYLYENTQANLEGIEQENLPAPVIPAPKRRAHIARPKPPVTEDVEFETSESLKVHYNGTQVHLPPNTTEQEALMALSQIYPELRHASLKYNAFYRRYDAVPHSSQKYY